jgi:hypothetical protein
LSIGRMKMTKWLECFFCERWFAYEHFEKRHKEHPEDPDACLDCYERIMANAGDPPIEPEPTTLEPEE